VSRREWLETNGLGGWAASTVSGAHSRRYHGLLVAAMDPPVGCLVMLSRREETIVVDVDGVSGNHDSVVRPNQLFALSPPFPLVESEWARRVLEVARQQLATSRGLRSLSPEDPQYRGHYGGDPLARDGATIRERCGAGSSVPI
jgi:glycogen debranching enzyme